MKTVDWIVFGSLVVLALVPDPSDLIDLGTPFLELVSAGVYYIWRRK